MSQMSQCGILHSVLWVDNSVKTYSWKSVKNVQVCTMHEELNWNIFCGFAFSLTNYWTLLYLVTSLNSAADSSP